VIGLAWLAARLATERVKNTGSFCWTRHSEYWWLGVSRDEVDESTNASAEYYAIIDRIARGEKP
jgi:hypothetical protein